MVIHASSALQHWNYFLALEDDLTTSLAVVREE